MTSKSSTVLILKICLVEVATAVRVSSETPPIPITMTLDTLSLSRCAWFDVSATFSFSGPSMKMTAALGASLSPSFVEFENTCVLVNLRASAKLVVMSKNGTSLNALMREFPSEYSFSRHNVLAVLENMTVAI